MNDFDVLSRCWSDVVHTWVWSTLYDAQMGNEQQLARVCRGLKIRTTQVVVKCCTRAGGVCWRRTVTHFNSVRTEESDALTNGDVTVCDRFKCIVCPTVSWVRVFF